MPGANGAERPHGELPVRVVHLMGRLSITGGVQVVVRQLAAAVDPNRVDLHIVTMRPRWDDLSEVPASLHALGFDGSRYRLRDRISIIWKMARTVRRLRPDVVQVHSGMAWLGLLARVVSPRTAFALEVHDAPGSGRHGDWTDRVEGWCLKWLGMTAICHSSQVAAEVATSSKAPRKRIRQFPLGTNTNTFQPVTSGLREAWRADNSLGVDAIIAIAVGRPAKSKRFEDLIDAVLQANKMGAGLHLVLVGVREDPSLASHVRTHDIHGIVRLTGPMANSDLPLPLGSSDILCSTSEYEGFGLTLIEGMACALPVIAMAVGGVTDIVVDGQTGYLVPSGDTEAFAQRLNELAQSTELRATVGAAGRERAQELFSLNAMALSFTELYEELAGRGNRTIRSAIDANK